jgi:hypothetical protein
VKRIGYRPKITNEEEMCDFIKAPFENAAPDRNALKESDIDADRLLRTGQQVIVSAKNKLSSSAMNELKFAQNKLLLFDYLKDIRVIVDRRPWRIPVRLCLHPRMLCKKIHPTIS